MFIDFFFFTYNKKKISKKGSHDIFIRGVDRLTTGSCGTFCTVCGADADPWIRTMFRKKIGKSGEDMGTGTDPWVRKGVATEV